MGKSVTLITGAGAGIGREFTRLALDSGQHVVAVSLLRDELQQLERELDAGQQRLTTLAMDLSEASAAQKLVQWCSDRALQVDVLINNAGFACFGETVDLNPAKLEGMLMLNMVTLTQLCHSFGGQMKQRRAGRILNVGSTAGMMPSPRIASYGATKSYVNTFSYALRVELAPYGVSVTCLTPGTVQTKFADTGGFLTFQGRSMLKKQYAAGRASSPADVARAGYGGMLAGKAQVLVGKGSTMASLASRLLPQRTLPGLLKNV